MTDHQLYLAATSDATNFKLLTTNKAEIKKFVSSLETVKLVILTYKNFLDTLNFHTNNLRDFLMDKYNIERKVKKEQDKDKLEGSPHY